MKRYAEHIGPGIAIITLMVWVLVSLGCAPNGEYVEGRFDPNYSQAQHHHRYTQDYADRRRRPRHIAGWSSTDHGYGDDQIVDRYGDTWERCHIRGRPAWCRVE